MAHKWLVKHPEVEEAFDLAFYRPLGYGISMLLRPTRVSPDHVSITAALVGVAGGHLLLYGAPWLDAAGGLALVLSALLDSVDGQLARLRGTSSPGGRMHDGMSDSLVFISVYVHLAGRLVRQGASPLLLPFAVALVANQFLANALADLYRHAYLRFALRVGSEGELSEELRRQQAQARAERAPWLHRLLLWFYVRVALQQEDLNPRLSTLRRRPPSTDEEAAALAVRYRARLQPLLPHLAWLGTNVRVALVLAVLALDAVPWFFWINLTVMNVALAAFVVAHERRTARLLRDVGSAAAAGS